MKLTRVAIVAVLAAGAAIAAACGDDPVVTPDAGTPDASTPDANPLDSALANDAGADQSSPDGAKDGATGDAAVEAAVEAGVDAGCIVALFGDHYARTDGHVLNLNVEVKTQAPDGGVGPALDGVVEGSDGLDFACGRRSNGTVYCWGTSSTNTGNSGELGDGKLNWPANTYVAQQVLAGTADAGPPVPLTDAIAINRDTAVNYRTITCVIRSDKTAWCWGTVVSPFGSPRLITSATSNAPTPVALPIVKQGGAPLTNVEEISVGLRHICAITSDNANRDSVYCWGPNISNEVGDTLPNATPVARPFPTKLTRLPAGTKQRLGAGPESTCVMVDDKTYCWGTNGYGQAGTGAPQTIQSGCSNYCENRDPAPPVLEGPADGGAEAGTVLTGLTVVHVGYHWVCGYGASKELRCWGDNQGGVNGDTYRMAGPLLLNGNPVSARLVSSRGAAGFRDGIRYVTPDGRYYQGGVQTGTVCP